MAEMIPESISAHVQATAGEKRVFSLLRDVLVPDEDYLVWFEPKTTGKRPDFLVWSPGLGLLIIEVKDWILSDISHATPDRWTLGRGESKVEHDNPLVQARRYAMRYKDVLQTSALLRQPDGFYRGSLRFPVGWCAAFTKIHRRDAHDLLRTLEPSFCFFAEDLSGDWTNPEAVRTFKAKLKRAFSIQFAFDPLERQQLDNLRSLIFPEVRVLNLRQASAPLRSEADADLFRALDLNQERIAKSIPEGHRILKGVAGSGKTVVISCRAQYLKHIRPDWRVLIVCFGVAMSRYLQQLVEASGIAADQIEISHYFELVKRLTHANCGPLEGEDEEAWHTRVGRMLRDQIADGRVAQRYDAILVDEGQDFALEWIRSLTDLLEPASDCLLFCHDPAQDIFGRRTTYKSLGIKVQGKRAIELKRSYRNTVEILDLARRFSHVEPSHPAGEEAKVPAEATLFPVALDRHGLAPQVLHSLTQTQQISYILDSIERHIATQACTWCDIAVLHTSSGGFGRHFAEAFGVRFGLEKLYEVTRSRESKRDFQLASPSVKLCTIESAKGMEFQLVYLVGLEALPRGGRDEAGERNCVYVGLTRAQDQLFILGNQPIGFLGELNELAVRADGSLPMRLV